MKYDDYLSKHSYLHLILGNTPDNWRKYPRLSSKESGAKMTEQLRQMELQRENVK